jgi:hypothetical protein
VVGLAAPAPGTTSVDAVDSNDYVAGHAYVDAMKQNVEEDVELEPVTFDDTDFESRAL